MLVKEQPDNPGDIVVRAVSLAKALDDAVPKEGGTIFVWAANAPEQIEAALADLGWELKPATAPQPDLFDRESKIRMIAEHLDQSLTWIESDLSITPYVRGCVEAAAFVAANCLNKWFPFSWSLTSKDIVDALDLYERPCLEELCQRVSQLVEDLE